jgi:hypothetical protein
VSENRGAVDSFPVEGVVWELVECAPAQFLSNEEFYFSTFGDLGKLRTITKRVRQEEDLWLDVKLILEEMLSIQELSNH